MSPPKDTGIERALEARLPLLLDRWRAELAGAPQPRHSRMHGAGRTFSSPAPCEASLAASELEIVGNALLRLQRGLTGGRKLAGASYMDDPALLGAYLLYYWPVSYLQTALALASLPHLPRVRRVLDLGAGPGPAAAVVSDKGATDIVLVDSSERALGLAAKLVPSSTTAARVTVHRIDLESPEAGRKLPQGPFDAVLVSHAVNELWKTRDDRLNRRCALLEAALARLAPGGFLLVIEPAPLLTSREALALRDHLVMRGHPVLGPCLADTPCPALVAGAGHTCHGDYPWTPPEPLASLAAYAGLERTSVKMTWFALGALRQPPQGLETATAGTTCGQPSILARVVSDPMLNKAGRLRYLICGAEGRRSLSAPKDDSRALSAGFAELGRYDLIRITRPELRGDPDAVPGAPCPLGLGPESHLETLEHAPRP